MKLRSAIFLLTVLALGLSAGYLQQNNPFAKRAGAIVRSGDFDLIQTRVNSEVVLYSTGTCPYCRSAKEFLTRRGVAYAELPVDVSMDARQEAKSLGAVQVPFLLIGSDSIEGYDEDRILALLNKQRML